MEDSTIADLKECVGKLRRFLQKKKKLRRKVEVTGKIVKVEVEDSQERRFTLLAIL